MSEIKIRFQSRNDLIPFTKNEWLFYVSAHALALSVVFPNGEWRKYMIKHGDEQQKLSTDEFTFQNQKGIVELAGSSWVLSTHDFIDALKFSEVRRFLDQDLKTFFEVEQLKKLRIPRSPDDFRD